MLNRFEDPVTVQKDKSKPLIPSGKLLELPTFINEYIGYYTELRNVCKKFSIDQVSVLMPNVIDMISRELSNNFILMAQGLRFLSLIDFYSLSVCSDPSRLRDEFINMMIQHRVISPSIKDKYLLEDENTIAFYYEGTEESLREFIKANPIILALFIYSLLFDILNLE